MTAEGACDIRTGFMGRMCHTCGRDDFGGPDHPADCPMRASTDPQPLDYEQTVASMKKSMLEYARARARSAWQAKNG